MLTLEKDELVIRFPEVHPDAVCRLTFHRTLRIPDDNRVHKLPPALGHFPLFHVDDHADRLPPEWKQHGGVFLPMYQAEAMWIRFSSNYPFAVKIAAGKINAVSGESWTPELRASRGGAPLDERLTRTALLNGNAQGAGPGQDYITVPGQPWLDGFNVGKGMIRQFVAMPLGAGYSAEEQITGEALHGGLQLIVYPIKPEFYNPPRAIPRVMASSALRSMSLCASANSVSGSMGLAPGGLIKQDIYEDKYGFAKWDTLHSAKCFVHLLNSQQFKQVTGRQPPHPAPTAASYTTYGMPWFDYYDEHQTPLPGAPALSQLDSVAALGIKKGESPLPDNEPVVAPRVVKLGNTVRQGDF